MEEREHALKTTKERVTAHSAFVVAQSEMKNAVMNQTNPFFKSKYADLNAIRDATLSILNKHGLGIIQCPTLVDGQFGLGTWIISESGEKIADSFYPIKEGTPQEVGSAITYARRYSWSSMCGICADVDDDGNVAQKAAEKTNELQVVANKIGKELKEAKFIKDLDDVWASHSQTVNEIKDKSERAWRALMTIYEKQFELLKKVEETAS